jgi:hypothetical protein
VWKIITHGNSVENNNTWEQCGKAVEKIVWEKCGKNNKGKVWKISGKKIHRKNGEKMRKQSVRKMWKTKECKECEKFTWQNFGKKLALKKRG